MTRLLPESIQRSAPAFPTQETTLDRFLGIVINRLSKPMNFKKIAFCILITSASSFANAGFLAGLAVGAVVTGSGSNGKEPTPFLVASDAHDVIMCEKQYGKGEVCTDDLRDKDERFIRHLKPEEYAMRAGYNIVHRKAVVITDKRVYIAMEVSRSTAVKK